MACHVCASRKAGTSNRFVIQGRLAHCRYKDWNITTASIGAKDQTSEVHPITFDMCETSTATSSYMRELVILSDHSGASKNSVA